VKRRARCEIILKKISNNETPKLWPVLICSVGGLGEENNKSC